MIRAIGNKRLDLSHEEFSYYKEMINHVDEKEFVGIFETDKNGIITNVMPDPDKQTSLIVYFFLMNVSFNQRLRKLDSFITNKEFEYENKISIMQEKIKKLEDKLFGVEKWKHLVR